MKYFDQLSDEEIINVNIPTGVPLVYEFNDDMNVTDHYYLADADTLNQKMNAVAKQGQAK